MTTNDPGRATPAPQPDRSVGGRIGTLAPYVGVVGFVVNLAIAVVSGTDDWRLTTLELMLFWLVGMQGIIVGSGHLFMPGPVAQSIGWSPSPFQWEVGLADVSYGVLGVMSPAFGRQFWLATIVVFSIFMLGAAAGHVRSMVRDHDFAPGNAGYFFWYDVIVPLALIALYVVTR